MDPNARDMLILTEWFEGEFDNEEQRWFHKRNGGEDEPAHRRLHAIHKRLDLPQIGEHVFHLQHYLDDDPNNVMRQRIGVFVSEPEGNVIRMKQGIYKDNDRSRDAHLNPDKLSGLTEDDIYFVEGCDLFWRREADQYVANMGPKACAFGESDLYRYSIHRWTLSKSKLWLVDSSFLMSDDSLHIGLPEDQPFRMRRAKTFICKVTFRDNGESQTFEGLKIHSQGGLVWLKREFDGETLGFRIREKEYPFYDSLPDLLFYAVRKPGDDSSVVSSFHDIDSRRLGLSTDRIFSHCQRGGYEFREVLGALP